MARAIAWAMVVFASDGRTKISRCGFARVARSHVRSGSRADRNPSDAVGLWVPRVWADSCGYAWQDPAPEVFGLCAGKRFASPLR